MNILLHRSFVLYFLAIAGVTLCTSYTGFGQITPGDSVKLRPENLKIKSTVKPVSTNRYPASGAASKQDSYESALAKSLADELKKAEVAIDEKDIDDIIQAITKGGQAAMAVALNIVASISEIETKQKSQRNSSTQEPGVQLSVKQIDDIIHSFTKKDSTLRLSQYLNGKLTQLKKDR